MKKTRIQSWPSAPRLSLGLLLGLWAWPALATAGEGGIPAVADPSLVAGHLAQVRTVAQPSATGLPGGTAVVQAQADSAASQAALDALRSQTVKAQTAWQKQMGRDRVLAGVAPEVWAEAVSMAADDAAFKQRLQSGVSLDLVLALTALRNKEVNAAYLNWRAALNRFDQADYLQSLVGQYRSFVREIDTQVGPQPGKEEDDRTFAAPSVVALKGQLVDQDVEIARLAYLEVLRTELMEAAREYFETQFHAQLTGILSSNRVLVTQMRESAEAQLKAGRVSQADVLKTQSMLEMIDNKIVQEIDHVLPHHVALLNGLLNLPPDTVWHSLARVDLPAELPALADTLAAVRQDNLRLRMAEQEFLLMQTMLRMAETMVLPRGSQGYSRLKLSEGAEAGPTRSMEAAFPEQPMVAMPMADLAPNLAWLEELRVRVKQAETTRDGIRSAVLSDGRVKYHYAYLAVRTLQTYDSVTPQSNQAFDLLKSSYAAGTVPLVEYLDAGRTYFDNVLMQEEARMELNMRWLDLEGVRGRSIGARLSGKARVVVLPLPIPPTAPIVPGPVPTVQ